MPVLFTPQPVGQTIGRKFHVIVGDDRVFLNRPFKFAAFDKAFGQVALLAHLLNIRRLAVGHVHAVIVKQLVSVKLALGDRAHFNDRATQWLGERVAEQDYAGYRIRCLEVNQVVRDEKRIERPVPHFIQTKIVLLLGIGMFGQTIDLRERRTDHIINDATEPTQFVDVVKFADLHDIVLVIQAAGHAARFDHEPGGVRHDGLLEADLRAVGKACHHGRILSPLVGKTFLRRRIAVRVLQPLDVAYNSRGQPKSLDPAIEVHLQARLVSVTRRQDHSAFGGIDLENRADGGVEFSVHQHHVFLMLESLDHDVRAELDRTGYIDQHVDLLRTRKQESVFRDDRLAGPYGILQLDLRVGDDNVLETRIFEDMKRLFEFAAVNGDHAHAGNAVHNLIGQPLCHETGAEQRHANRFALLLAGFQYIINDDHVLFLSLVNSR